MDKFQLPLASYAACTSVAKHTANKNCYVSHNDGLVTIDILPCTSTGMCQSVSSLMLQAQADI